MAIISAAPKIERPQAEAQLAPSPIVGNLTPLSSSRENVYLAAKDGQFTKDYAEKAATRPAFACQVRQEFLAMKAVGHALAGYCGKSPAAA